jgi:asparagine synthase (glutamine-hydrolysing)
MCGFVGQLGPRPVDLGAAIASLRHRGPDDEGSLRTAAGAGFLDLGFRRLAILDLSPAGHQPMQSDDGKLALVWNGEAYNFRALRRELEDLGARFRSQSDTEVVLRGYERWGDAVLHRLRGMFAFALWDGRRERLLLARDRVGIKPLYYALGEGSVAFGSELKALLALGRSRRLDPTALVEYLRYLHVLPPRTMFRDLRQLGAGERLVFERGTARVERWWDAVLRPEPRDHETLVAELRAQLQTAVALHLESDVPLGAFLSGGLDSSTIAALATRSGRRLRTFCMTFGPGAEAYDERDHARAVAKHCGTEHVEIPVEPSVTELLPQILRHFDEPFGNPTALLAWELSRKAREHVTVALAGDGGDELFLGYPRHAGARLLELYERSPFAVRSSIARLIAPALPESTRGRHWPRRLREFLSAGTLPPAAAYDEWVSTFTPPEIDQLLASREPQAASRSVASLFADAPAAAFRDQLGWVDVKSFLPGNLLAYTDRMSMAHGLEVRVPFCDHQLVERCLQVPFDQHAPHLRGKALLREAMRDLLPESTLRRGKLGFNPPMGLWLNRELKPLVDERLAPERLKREGLLEPSIVSKLIAEHRSGKRDRSLHLWALLVLETWRELYRPT